MQRRLVLIAAVLAVAACAQPSGPTTGSSSAPQGSQSASSGPTTLQAVMKVEPASLAAHPLTPTGISIALPQRMFNATLDIDDGQEQTHPYLAEALPRVGTDSWEVLPDGGMRTTWRLKPGITWHDGAPLGADDFVFANEIYQT